MHTYLRIAERDHAAWHQILQHQASDGKELSGCRLRPILMANFVSVLNLRHRLYIRYNVLI